MFCFFPLATIFYLKLLKVKIKIQRHTYEIQQLKSSEPGLWDRSGLAECEVRGHGHEKLLRHRHVFCISSSAEQSHHPIIWFEASFQPRAQSIHSASHLQTYDVTLTWGRGVQASPLRKTNHIYALLHGIYMSRDVFQEQEHYIFLYKRQETLRNLKEKWKCNNHIQQQQVVFKVITVLRLCKNAR